MGATKHGPRGSKENVGEAGGLGATGVSTLSGELEAVSAGSHDEVMSLAKDMASPRTSALVRPVAATTAGAC